MLLMLLVLLQRPRAPGDAPGLPTNHPNRRPRPNRRPPQKKRVKGMPAETYRDRWLKRLPRKSMASWLSGICSACERTTSAGPLIACAGPCMRSFHLP
jgi:hypothetical protein